VRVCLFKNACRRARADKTTKSTPANKFLKSNNSGCCRGFLREKGEEYSASSFDRYILLSAVIIILFHRRPKEGTRELGLEQGEVAIFFPKQELAVVGVMLSCYALYVEHKVGHLPEDEEFLALCDIKQIGASCRCVE
jgi:hypothetical protein